ncbi:TPA: pentapeptide repeat-containing protein [Pasteurella multocida]
MQYKQLSCLSNRGESITRAISPIRINGYTPLGIAIDLLKENFMKNAQNNKLNFRGANLQGTTLREFDLSTADFTFADISGADLGETILSKAKLAVDNVLKSKSYLCR